MRKKIVRRGRYYVYILKCSNGAFYTGYTNNLTNRIKLHNSGKGARYTRNHRPVKLIWRKKYKYFKLAFKKEIAIKKLTRTQKEELIKNS